MKSHTAHRHRPRTSKIASIGIHNLRLRTFIGFNPDEMEKIQDVVINITIRYHITDAALRDCVDEALNYKTVTKRVINHVENGRFLLLEKLVSDVLDICSQGPDIIHSQVTIEKPHALRFADSVSLTLEYSGDEATQLTLLEKAS